MHKLQSYGGSTKETEAKSMAETKNAGIFEMCCFLRALDKRMAEPAYLLIIFWPLCSQISTI